MSTDTDSDSPPSTTNSRSSCGGYRTVLFVFSGLVGALLLSIVALILVGQVDKYYADRAEMRKDLKGFGLAHWVDCPADAEISFVFTGSSSHYYRLSAPPQDAPTVLKTLQSCGFQPTTKPDITAAAGVTNLSWWQPQDETDLETLVFTYSKWPSWYAAASKKSGHVYLYKVGH